MGLFQKSRPASPSQSSPWAPAFAAANAHPELAAQLRQVAAAGPATHVDLARLTRAVRQASGDPDAISSLLAEIRARGVEAGLVPGRERYLPGSLVAQHNLIDGQVAIGVVANDPRNPGGWQRRPFGLDLDVLRTSMLVLGPPGSGKTRSIAVPVLEQLAQQSLANAASVVVLDPKGDDFDYDGWFDVVIDPLDPSSWGMSLFGGSETADEAADRLASALLPPAVSDDKSYFVDASKNALYWCLEAFFQAMERWPTVRELIGLLRGDQAAHDRVKSALKGPGAKDYKELLDRRKQQVGQRADPAASLVERLSLLDKPVLRNLLDERSRTFSMKDINRPVRVRISLPESRLPDASRILARLAVSQFTQVVSDSSTNRSIFKCLMVDEAGRFIDDYVARAVQKIRSNNAGLLLLTQSLGDFPRELLPTIFTSVGCKAVFGGIDPDDAKRFSQAWGSKTVADISYSRNRGSSVNTSLDRDGNPHQSYSESRTYGSSTRYREEENWSVADLTAALPVGNAVMQVARSNGDRSPALLVNCRFGS